MLMKTRPEAFIEDFLKHEEPYNSQAAHEYYLRNRELKGRQPAAPDEVSRYRSPAVTKGATAKPKGKVVPVKGKAKGVSGAKAITKVRQAAVNGRVASLQKRLAELETLLSELLSEAGKKAAKDASKSDQTAKQKDAAAKSSKEYAEKNKEEIAEKAKEKREADPDANLNIEEVRAKIAKIKDQLKTAIGDARKKSSNSKTVKGR